MQSRILINHTELMAPIVLKYESGVFRYECDDSGYESLRATSTHSLRLRANFKYVCQSSDNSLPG
ncbi:MAG TPA: hypothetical protein VJ983_09130 [candidate division Zixibacteria bacterium]|nr:hypothetical protein [candidate division Zixibacteria bacterium]